MQTPADDSYAKGMVCYTGSASEATPTLDLWQYRLFRKYLGSRILEMGAGDGRITRQVIAGSSFDELIAAEPSDHFFALLCQKTAPAPRVSLVQATTAELLARYRGYFDSVFSVHVLEHIEKDSESLAEQLKLVCSGGAVIVLVPALQSLYSDLDRNIGHFRRYDKSRFRSLAAELPDCHIEALFYNNLIGVPGSFYFSKLRKIHYQDSIAKRENFARIYTFFSERVIPIIDAIESRIPVPLGLNLTCVLRKH